VRISRRLGESAIASRTRLPRGIFGRSFALLSAAILAAALVFFLVGGAALGSAYAESGARELERAAGALAAAVPAEALRDFDAAAPVAAALASSGYRVTLIGKSGAVLADSEANPLLMENHGSRSEVASALSGRTASARRKSSTLGEELVYAAAPIRDSRGEVAGALRLALRLPTLYRALAPSRWTLGLASLAFALASLASALLVSRMTSRPLASLAAVARAYGSGRALGKDEGAAAIGEKAPEEMRVLAATLDAMAEEASARVEAAETQGKELEAILDAMTEAVLALDENLRVKLANPAAKALFGLSGEEGGRSILEATRSSDLQRIAAECLATGERQASELSLFLPAERSFQVFAAPMVRAPLARNALGGASGGVVIVLGDITELRRLERVRKDFVANVSHELRTPVQLVKGFSETLLDGALDDADQARRFVGIIGRNAARMESLIADLLSLAALEREGIDRLSSEKTAIRPILESAREAILPKAQAAGSEIIVDCDESLEAKVEAGLIEQAIVNLMDNAIKYSPGGSKVEAKARAEGDSLLLEVRDQGIGIPAADLPRVFERFYRVDKARSRDMGGTGLGLAIVRHIAMAHGGSVSVESWEGEGSTFRIRIPL
jgi:two-component system phosphate regulon sensor histidine kinase PhoR